MSTQQHQAQAKTMHAHVQCGIITVSDTRTEENDTSGQAIRELLVQAGHSVERYVILKDEPSQIVSALDDWTQQIGVEAILLNGGTGISRRDSTVEAVAGLLEKTIVGFGELFRMLSYQEIGSAAMLSRAVAGVYRGVLVVSMPGSTHAVRLAMEKLIIPQIAHLVWELKK